VAGLGEQWGDVGEGKERMKWVDNGLSADDDDDSGAVPVVHCVHAVCCLAASQCACMGEQLWSWKCGGSGYVYAIE